MSSSHYFLPHKIHYQIFDSLGRVARILEDSDAKESTGKLWSDNASNPAEGIDRVLDYEYNVRGDMIVEHSDNDADETIDKIDYFIVDANGYSKAKYTNNDALSTGSNFTADGRVFSGIESFEIYTPDAKGNIVITQFNKDAKGAVDSIEYLELDANDHVRAKYINKDGTETTGYTSDINGKPVKGINSITHYEYNARGQGYKISYDNNGDGTVDSIDYVELDANGAWLTKYVDSDPYASSGNTGNTIKIDTISPSLSKSLGVDKLTGINEIVYETHDAQGRRISESFDRQANGSIDDIRYIEHYPNGNWSGTYLDTDGSENTGVKYTINGKDVLGIDKQEAVYADERGYTTGRHWDNDVDGEFDTYEKIVTNQNGNWVEVHYDSNNDGKYEYSDFNILDEYGRVKGTKYITYTTPVEKITPIEQLTRADGEFSSNSYIRNANGDVLIRAYDSKSQDGLIDRLYFGAENYTVAIQSLLGSDKFTLGEINKSLTSISLSNNTAETVITLSASDIAAISKNTTLDIKGDATDTVKLVGNFTRKEGLTKTDGEDVLQAYNANVGGDSYTVYIDTDINTTIG